MASNPGPDFRLQAGDMVAVIGSSQARADFAGLIAQQAEMEEEREDQQTAAEAGA